MIKLFKRFYGIDWLLICVLVGVVVAQVYFDVTLPEYTDKVVREMTKVGATAGSILALGGRMLLIALGSVTCTVVVGYLAAHLAAKFSKRLRSDVFAKVQDMSFNEINKFSTASLVTRSTNDIQQVQMAVILTLRMAVSAPITAVWALIKIKASSAELTLASAGWVVLLAIFLVTVFAVVLPKFKLIQKMTDKLNGVTRENLTGLRVVKAYNADSYQQDKFEKVNDDTTKLHLFASRLMGMLMPMMIFVMNGVVLTIYWWGSSLINDGKLTVGVLMSFSGLAIQVIMAFMMLLMLCIMLPRAAVSAKRINEVLQTKITITDPKNPTTKFYSSGSVVFDNVSFKYPEAQEYVLKNISFSVERGQTVAIMGSTGSGKSTLINLIPRFFEVTEGRILVDNVDTRDMTTSDLRSKIGYVPQKGMLFAGQIKDNIGYGNNQADDAQMQQFASWAMASEFIEATDEKYESHVAQGGKNFSGGQRQRLAIARAIAAQPEIFIFDDSFSALDYNTDKAVRQNLKENLADATKIIVAQRIGTIMDADKIVVLEQGEAVGIGTHRELLNSCEVYREIALSQLTEEELGL